jgi:hypothetical protein
MFIGFVEGAWDAPYPTLAAIYTPHGKSLMVNAIILIK